MTGKHSVLLFVFSIVLAFGTLVYVDSGSATPLASADGHGTLFERVDTTGRLTRRQFSFSARMMSDGTVMGNAVFYDPAADAAEGWQPYALHIDISCMNVIGNTVFFGGTTSYTTDPALADAVFFSAENNEETGAGKDRLSRAFFFDDDPNTNGDPQLCQNNQVGDFPMEFIENGDIGLRP
jgi:hypothetical protein